MSTDRQLSFTAFAPAKLNLFLHIVGKHANGYHDIESLFIFLDLGDKLSFEPDPQQSTFSLSIDGPFGDGLKSPSGNAINDNLILQAASHLREIFPQYISHGGHFHLSKYLPISSGIGGGSSDAAAAAHLLKNAYQLKASKTQLAKHLLSLGADIPACIIGRPAIIKGIGDKVTPIFEKTHHGQNKNSPPILLVNPLIPVPTKTVFESLTLRDWTGKKDLRPLLKVRSYTDIISYAKSCNNDLESRALDLLGSETNPNAILSEYPAKLVRMSGSGATWFAIFQTAEECRNAGQKIREQHPDWWIKQTKFIT